MRLKRPEGLNIIPFIDIMLALLAIVLTVATFVSQQSMKVAIPKATQATVKIPEKSYEILIQANGDILFQNQKVAFEDLTKALASLSDKDSIVLRADKKSEFGIFVQIVDFLKKEHKEHINIVVKKD